VATQVHTASTPYGSNSSVFSRVFWYPINVEISQVSDSRLTTRKVFQFLYCTVDSRLCTSASRGSGGSTVDVPSDYLDSPK
jgi:hypothetical protein